MLTYCQNCGEMITRGSYCSSKCEQEAELTDRMVENARRRFCNEIIAHECPACGDKTALPNEKFCRKCQRTGKARAFVQAETERKIEEKAKTEAEREVDRQRRERRKLHQRGQWGLSGGTTGKTAWKRWKREQARKREAIKADTEARRRLAEQQAKAEREAKLNELTKAFGEKEIKELSSDELEELIAA